MKVIHRYLASTVIRTSLIALMILLALTSFFNYVAQLDDLSGQYGAVEALHYVVLTLPRWAYELLPTAVLLGGLMGLGNLAAGSELIVLRTSGMSIQQIANPVLVAGLVLALMAFTIGEFLAPKGEQHAQMMRASAQKGYVTLQSSHGFWARDGLSYVNIRRVLPGQRLEDISIYAYDEDQKLVSFTRARSARFKGEVWHLEDIKKSEISDQGVITKDMSSDEWDSLIRPDLLTVLTVKPTGLELWSLAKFIHYLKDNNLDAKRYQLAYWVKVITPFSNLVMLLISIPFVFGPLRSANSGVRVLVGTLVGIGFYVINQVSNNVGLIYGLNPLLSASLPSFLFALGGTVAMRRL